MGQQASNQAVVGGAVREVGFPGRPVAPSAGAGAEAWRVEALEGRALLSAAWPAWAMARVPPVGLAAQPLAALQTAPTASPLRATQVSVPATPGVLRATIAGVTVSLSWRDRSTNETGFRVERSTRPDAGFQDVGGARANKPRFLDAGATPGTTAYYRVRAINRTGSSGYSNVVAVAVPAPAPVPTPGPFDGPIVITQGGVYSGRWESMDANVPAVSIRTSEPVVIENSVIRSRAACIDVMGVAANLTVRNTQGYGLNPNVAGKTPGRFLDVDGWVNLDAENNYLDGTSGIYLYNYLGDHSTNNTIKVLRNVVRNIDGRTSDGNGGWLPVAANPDFYKTFFQTNGITDLPGVEVAWNQVVNEQGASRVEESINIFASSGTPASPFQIHDNYIQGAFPANPVDAQDYTGGGIMVSDVGTSYVQAFNNQIVATGSEGLAISSGHDNTAFNNRILSSGTNPDGSPTAYSNVGLTIWNFNHESTFTNNTAHDNMMGWVSADGSRADWWVPDAAGFDNNVHWPGTLSQKTESMEFALWQTKASRSGVTLGPAQGYPLPQARHHASARGG